MKLLYVTYFYPPETGAGAVRAHYNVRALRERGHEVLVLAPLPNYPKGTIFPGWKGELFTFDKAENILRVYIRPSISPKPWSRLMPYGSFDVSGLVSGILARLRMGRFDAIVASSPPLPGMAFVPVLAAMLRAPLTMEFRDIWPDVGLRMGILRPGSPETRITRAIEWSILRTAKKCIVTAQGDVQNLMQKGVPQERIALIPNGADTELFRPEAAMSKKERIQRFGGANRFSIIYSGSFNFGMNDVEMLHALAIEAERSKKFVLYLVGDGKGMQKIKSSIGLDSKFVRTIPPMDHNELAPLMASCDAGIVPLKNNPDTGGNIPVKMFEYWAAGLPVLLGAHEQSNTLPIFNRTNGGIHFAAEDLHAAIEAIETLAAMPSQKRRKLGQNGRKFVETSYSRRFWANEFAAAVEESVRN